MKNDEHKKRFECPALPKGWIREEVLRTGTYLYCDSNFMFHVLTAFFIQEVCPRENTTCIIILLKANPSVGANQRWPKSLVPLLTSAVLIIPVASSPQEIHSARQCGPAAGGRETSPRLTSWRGLEVASIRNLTTRCLLFVKLRAFSTSQWLLWRWGAIFLTSEASLYWCVTGVWGSGVPSEAWHRSEGEAAEWQAEAAVLGAETSWDLSQEPRGGQNDTARVCPRSAGGGHQLTGLHHEGAGGEGGQCEGRGHQEPGEEGGGGQEQAGSRHQGPVGSVLLQCNNITHTSDLLITRTKWPFDYHSWRLIILKRK